MAEKPRALVVDDDTVARMVVEHMLVQQGLEVTSVDSVDAATSHLTDNAVDVIVCDYVMPEKSGLDLLESLGEVRPRFVLLTGTSERDDVSDERALRVDAYLTKPVSSRELSDVIADQLRIRDAA